MSLIAVVVILLFRYLTDTANESAETAGGPSDGEKGASSAVVPEAPSSARKGSGAKPGDLGSVPVKSAKGGSSSAPISKPVGTKGYTAIGAQNKGSVTKDAAGTWVFVCELGV